MTQRNRVIYQCQTLLVGPAPASGYYFLNYTGGYNNDSTNDRPAKTVGGSHRGESWPVSAYTTTTYQSKIPGAVSAPMLVDRNQNNLVRNFNLLHKIDRVQAIAYSISEERSEIKQLGRVGTVARPVINHPTIKLDFGYLQMGLRNEARLGMNVNYSKLHYPFSGDPVYPDNFKVFLFSGMTTHSLNRPSIAPYWPFDYRDKRNIHMIVVDEGKDAHKGDVMKFSEPDLLQGLNLDSPSYHLVSFGDCYLSSWSTQAAVGALPTCQVSYLAENMTFNLSGSGVPTPSLDPRDRSNISGVTLVIPPVNDEGGPSVLLPGDITVDLKTNSESLNIPDFGIDVTDIKINSYQISIDLNRESLNSLGYKIPRDRRVNLPLYASLSVEAVVGGEGSGAFHTLINKDSSYNVTIKMKSPECYDLHSQADEPPQHDGVAPSGAIVIRYDFLNAKFNGISYTNAIGDNKTVVISFITELNPENFNEGFFISGLLNIDRIQDFILYEHMSGVASGDKTFMIHTDSTPIVSNLIPLF